MKRVAHQSSHHECKASNTDAVSKLNDIEITTPEVRHAELKTHCKHHIKNGEIWVRMETKMKLK